MLHPAQVRLRSRIFIFRLKNILYQSKRHTYIPNINCSLDVAFVQVTHLERLVRPVELCQ